MRTDPSSVSRRTFLAAAGGAAAGLQMASLAPPVQAATALPALPWSYPSGGLNVDEVRKAAYVIFYKEGGCCHAASQSIIDAIAAKVPEPWAQLPRGIYKYGNGGVVGWGTICGALNGAIAVMGYLGVHSVLGNALIDYFCTAPLPTAALVNFVPPAGVPAPLASTKTSVSNSPLCHVSSATWAALAAVPIADAAKKDRCAKLTCDIVARAVELMNDKFLSNVTPPAWVPPASYATCYTCHTKPTVVPSQEGKMDCLECHTVSPVHDTWRRRIGR
jgi:hypothetical protein